MFVAGISGQHLGISFLSALSGTALTGLSGFISGYKSIDGGSQVGLSGYVTELGFGQYVANLFDYDTSGKIISYYFVAASNAIAVEKTVITTLNDSGYIYPASGTYVTANTGSGAFVVATILSGSLSGQPIAGLSGFIYPASGVYVASGIYPASGAFTITSVNSGSFVVASLLSGQTVNVYSGQLSGQPIAGLSGFIYPASGIWSASGVNVVTSVTSGTLYLASGSIFKNTFASGVLGTSGGLPTAWGNSGTVTVGQNLDKSGYTISTNLDKSGYNVSSVNSGILSGQLVTLVSGQSYTASGIWPASGAFVTANTGSGAYVIASLLSGQSVLVYSGQLSGQPIAGLSGFIYPASGVNVTATATVASGQVYLASGSPLFWSGLIYPASGSVYPASGSITSGVISSGIYVTATATVQSGIYAIASILSGQSVNVYSGQLSGQPIAGLSGFIYPASGINVNATATVTSGQVYLASGQAVSINSGQLVNIYSGQLSGQPIAGLSGFIYPASGVFIGNPGSVTAASGLYVTVPISTISGVYTASGIYPASGAYVIANTGSGAYVIATVLSGTLSGQPIAGLSGYIYPASGVYTTTSLQSGQVYIASGTNVVTSVNLDKSGYSISNSYDKSGYNVSSVNSGILSGQLVTLVSGQSYTASGINTVVPVSSISGVNSQSTLLSGQSVNVYSGQLSGQPIAGLSGYIYPASGVNVTATLAVQSGQVYLASGSIFADTFASGVIAVNIPYGILESDMSGVTGEAIHSPVNALRKLTNKWDTTSNSGFLTVYKENATNVAYTQALTSQSGAQPITALGDA